MPHAWSKSTMFKVTLSHRKSGDMSCSLNSLKGRLCKGEYRGLLEGNTRSVHYSSHVDRQS